MTTLQEHTQFLLETQAELILLPLMLPETTELETEARDQRITEDNIEAAKDFLPIKRMALLEWRVLLFDNFI
jgi:hypothetical protein